MAAAAALVAVETHPYYRKPYYYRPSYYKPSFSYKPPSYYSQREEHDVAGDPHDVAGDPHHAAGHDAVDVLHDAASDHDATPVSTGSVSLPAAEEKPVSHVSSGDPDLDLAVLLGETDGFSDSPSLPASPSNPTNFDVDIRAQR